MSFNIIFTGRFKQDYKTIKKRGYPLNKMEVVFKSIIEFEPLSPKYKVHKLSGDYSDCWECHILPDWLLIWRVDEKTKELHFIRTGTHSDLF
jgi:mRNA interferase YafQ